MTKNFTCIVCPMGCNLSVTHNTDGSVSVSGNTCPRGEEYGKNEMTNPVRVITTTVRCSDGTIIPVKTNRPIPKDKINDCMKIINKCNPPLPISVGDVIIKDVFGSDVVATSGSTQNSR